MAGDGSVRRTADDVDAFLAASPRAGTLQAVDAALRAGMPGAPRTLWRGVFWGGTDQAIVGYGDIRQPRPRGADVDWFLIGLAEQKNHVSLYVNAVADGAYLAHRYAERLGRVKVGSAVVTFRRLEDLDLAVVTEMAARAYGPS
ncbi:hypothetical protein [Demequina lignilytica]|uniref:YdhG-like domain-containing protein n=1 Tax=Demequina lignilytica TaxID=3051663 RepID=A0AAW7LZW4_9MICO|nr:MULTISPECIES: hypothetical protein [unclassified Demequina]MDN4478379.1 hypothetical protein [Demequina sp. SYSU T00039-1]MDN4482461.1 hypothetical protein [Demequina sp. SYSU T0a273]MDN4487114.1 hypothetical protein [Demequina sp. SYSU T00039]MDN4489825.1 hypothetical protein [Demequina sp. SYSU T00068]